MNFIFHFIYGMSSFPFTFFFRGLKPPTSINIYIYTSEILIYTLIIYDIHHDILDSRYYIYDRYWHNRLNPLCGVGNGSQSFPIYFWTGEHQWTVSWSVKLVGKRWPVGLGLRTWGVLKECLPYSVIQVWLVVWNMNFLTFHSVGNFIIPTDEVHHLSEGRSTTNHILYIYIYPLVN